MFFFLRVNEIGDKNQLKSKLYLLIMLINIKRNLAFFFLKKKDIIIQK